MRVTPALALMGAGLLAPMRAGAQGGAGADLAVDSVRAAWSDLTSRCVTPVANPYVLPAQRSACRVEGVTALGRIDGLDWYVARYLRELIVQDSGWADTMPIDEMVLAGRAPGAAIADVVLRWTSDRRMLFLDTLEATPTSQGVLLELTACLNGTGGCGQDYFRLARGTWRTVVQAFGKDLAARLPPDHSLHKGRRLDLATGNGVWPVAARDDANCCPSYEIAFRARLDGDTLRLVEAGPLRRTTGQ